MRQIDMIVVHCTATRPEWQSDQTTEAKVAEVKKWHTDKGWSDVGYHYLIDRNGVIVEGRPVERAGAHAKGYNATSIGVAIFGGHGGTANDEFEENFTDAQDRSLRRLIAQLRMEFPNITQIVGHNDLPDVTKACPTFRVNKWIAQDKTPPKEPRKSLAQSKTIQASQVTKIAGLATPLVGTLGGLDWQKLLILGALSIVILVGTGVIDIERTKKWKQGDR
jgi:N-acetyl-anhydromuramyl-L-alanine amidase AmpD